MPKATPAALTTAFVGAAAAEDAEPTVAEAALAAEETEERTLEAEEVLEFMLEPDDVPVEARWRKQN